MQERSKSSRKSPKNIQRRRANHQAREIQIQQSGANFANQEERSKSNHKERTSGTESCREQFTKEQRNEA